MQGMRHSELRSNCSQAGANAGGPAVPGPGIPLLHSVFHSPLANIGITVLVELSCAHEPLSVGQSSSGRPSRYCDSGCACMHDLMRSSAAENGRTSAVGVQMVSYCSRVPQTFSGLQIFALVLPQPRTPVPRGWFYPSPEFTLVPHEVSPLRSIGEQ
jgi:hypothetical protein